MPDSPALLRRFPRIGLLCALAALAAPGRESSAGSAYSFTMLNKDSGAVLWTVPTSQMPGVVYDYRAANDGILATGTFGGAGWVKLFKRTDGTLLWSKSGVQLMGETYVYRVRPAGASFVALSWKSVAGGFAGAIGRYTTATGAQAWKTAITGRLVDVTQRPEGIYGWGEPTGGGVLVQRYDTATGALAWEKRDATRSLLFCRVYPNGIVTMQLGSTGPFIVLYDLATGNVIGEVGPSDLPSLHAVANLTLLSSGNVLLLGDELITPTSVLGWMGLIDPATDGTIWRRSRGDVPGRVVVGFLRPAQPRFLAGGNGFTSGGVYTGWIGRYGTMTGLKLWQKDPGSLPGKVLFLRNSPAGTVAGGFFTFPGGFDRAWLGVYDKAGGSKIWELGPFSFPGFALFFQYAPPAGVNPATILLGGPTDTTKWWMGRYNNATGITIWEKVYSGYFHSALNLPDGILVLVNYASA